MKTTIHRNARGFSLIEVMIAVIVLAVGLLSLAALQGELFRSGAESKARANAATIAQQVIEDARSFGFINSPSVDYDGNTYMSLVSDDWDVEDVSGVTFTVEREVIRYRWNGASFVQDDAGTFSVAVPEFKLVRVNVSWPDAMGGEGKSIQMADSIAAIAPADITKVMQGPSGAQRGPEFWIVPPNEGDARVVPIAVGADQSSASSNPTPEQFIEDASAVTRFSVLSFTGDTELDEVQLNRRLDMAAASCVCTEGTKSTAANPSYKPTVWNGILLAYEEPATNPAGTPIGVADVGNDSEIEPICTVCCRDHHLVADSTPAPDPWRAAISPETSSGAHYTYEPKGQGFVFGELQSPSDHGGMYLDSCQLTRVNGRMRITVDAQQSSLVTTALNSLGSGYLNSGFVDDYSSYVVDHLEEAMAAGMPTGYPSPSAGFPGPSSGVNAAYPGIVDPAAIEFDEGDVVDLVAFGLYIDYLSEDTLLAYRCAQEVEGEVGNDEECEGLRDREPLSVLPFYAVNVASLGAWEMPTGQTVADVSNATYQQGLLDEKGGAVTGGKGASPVDTDGEPIPTPATISINNSNTGLAGTLPFDPDDALSAHIVSDTHGFVKGEGLPEPSTNVLSVTVASGPLNFKTMGISFGMGCDPKNALATCQFESPVSSISMTFSNYNEEVKVKGVPTLVDRMVCLPSHAKIFSVTESGSGLGQTTTVVFVNLAAVDYALSISVQAQGLCDSTGLSMTP